MLTYVLLSFCLSVVCSVGECQSEGGPCQQLCYDLHDGTFECGCSEGYVLSTDGYSCHRKSRETTRLFLHFTRIPFSHYWLWSHPYLLTLSFASVCYPCPKPNPMFACRFVSFTNSQSGTVRVHELFSRPATQICPHPSTITRSSKEYSDVRSVVRETVTSAHLFSRDPLHPMSVSRCSRSDHWVLGRLCGLA